MIDREKQSEERNGEYKDFKRFKIYALKDPFTLQIRYIGVTTQDLDRRLHSHIVESKSGKYNNKNPRKSRWIKSVIDKGKKPLITLIEYCNNENWANKERLWIKRTNDLVNLSKGGVGVFCNRLESSIQAIRDKISRKVIQLTLDGKLVKEWNSIKEASCSTGKCNSGAIGNCLKERTPSAFGFVWLYKEEYEAGIKRRDNKNVIKVYQYDKKGNYMKTWNSMLEAQREYGVHVSEACIKGWLAKNYQFKYYYSETIEPYKLKRNVPIEQLDDNMIVICNWDSRSEAAKFIGCDSSSISLAIRDNRKSFGFYWREVYD